MKEDTRKDVRKLEDKDLDTVSGGFSVYSRQSPNTGRYIPEDRVLLSDVVTDGKAAGASNLTGNSGLGTASAYCPKCGSMTKHIVFNGGRGKCSVCGHIQEKL